MLKNQRNWLSVDALQMLPQGRSMELTDVTVSSAALYNGRGGSQLVQSLQRVGFAIIELPTEEIATLRDAHRAATAFFLSHSVEDKQTQRLLFDCGNHGRTLLGWNAPHPAKELFRLRRGVTHGSPLFHGVANALRDPALAALDLLERLCTRVASLALDSIGAPEAFLREHTDLGRVDSFSTSPFDFFYYTNNPVHAHLENCSRHIDPGIMTVVPVSPSPGLALLHPVTGEWIRIEEQPQLRPLQHVVAFTGHTLQELASHTLTPLPGIVHCVYKGQLPRFSMVYELRPITQIHQRPPSSFSVPSTQ